MDFARVFLRIVALIIAVGAVSLVMIALGAGLFLATRDIGALVPPDCILVMPECG